ncbi:MAG: translation elongation factor 4 [Candidatus Sericytochromatia bacterium]|nr:translation elongation factor 4 [Candidatus Sericytochromatia bacterium]
MTASHPQERIRNFCIIAHIDHGKSTLADRLIEITGTLSEREMSDQVLDSMDIERERGITIKAQAVRLNYRAVDGNDYVLNLIDTPGHVDFTYEVSRSLQACEGALLVVDASQGVEAQTLANVYLALEHDLEIVPVLNKIDLPGAEPERVRQEIEDDIGLDASEAIMASAKEGKGVPEILEAIVKHVPPPAGDREAPLQALVFDSYFESYRGVIIFFRVVNGTLKVGDRIRMMATGASYEVTEVGVLSPKQTPVRQLAAGEVGYLAASIKNVQDARVGDTITHAARPAAEAVPGYKPAVPMVFCGLYPVSSDEYQGLRDALEKLSLNDASLVYEPESSVALGFGFRCGFLGLLHMEVVQERLERHYGLSLVATAPSVSYHVFTSKGDMVVVSNPTHMPPPATVERIEEPYVKVTVLSPTEFVGAVMELSQARRAIFKQMDYLTSERTRLIYEMPLPEMISDYFDALKSRTKGYASMDYELIGYREGNLVKMDILLAGDQVDALSCIVHRDKAASVGRGLAEKLREIIPRQMFEVPIQAAIGSKVIARETISAKRKDVLAKCYGGDISRKRKLLEKQKEGKKRMKQVGRVEIPQEAFMAVLKMGDS